MSQATKDVIIKLCALSAIGGLSIALLGDAGLIIIFLGVVLMTGGKR